MSSISYFYLKGLCHIQGTYHPFACVAFEKVSKDKYRMSYYVHNSNKGPFIKKMARTAAVGRLNSERKSCVICTGDLQNIDIFLDVSKIMDRYKGPLILKGDKISNDKRLTGAMSELNPRKELSLPER
jgi:hypothetical protein